MQPLEPVPDNGRHMSLGEFGQPLVDGGAGQLVQRGREAMGGQPPGEQPDRQGVVHPDPRDAAPRRAGPVGTMRRDRQVAHSWGWGYLASQGCGAHSTLLSLVGRLAREGCTRSGSPGILGYSGG